MYCKTLGSFAFIRASAVVLLLRSRASHTFALVHFDAPVVRIKPPRPVSEVRACSVGRSVSVGALANSSVSSAPTRG